LAATDIIDAFDKNPNFAEPDVPETIVSIKKFLSFPGNSSKRAAFAMIRTIENLVSSIIRYSVEFFAKTAEKLLEDLSTAASRTIVGLLGLALMSATGIGPAALRAGAPWVNQAAEIVKKQIEQLAE
jgi:hypothetical protein